MADPLTNVSRETSRLLDRLAQLVRKWTGTINLVAPDTVPFLCTRHIEDSLEVAALCPFGSKSWCDIGSGGGFPGIVCAVVLRDTPIQFSFIESDARKAEFLRTACRELGLTGTVINDRAETVAPLGADVVSARAVAPLGGLIPLAIRHGAPDAVFLFPKGSSYPDELTAARANWSFQMEVVPSRTRKGSVILKIEDISHV